MEDFNAYVAIYKEQLQKGDILIAYNGLVKFVMQLRTNCIKELPNTYVFGGILHGYLDYTYFYFTNSFLKSKKLKLGLVLNHMDMRFEVWLLGNTLPIQKKYWELLKDSEWGKQTKEMPTYAILEIPIVTSPDFNQPKALMKHIQDRMLIISEEVIAAIEVL